jgi:GNAT superfamily N-acetyltransferase
MATPLQDAIEESNRQFLGCFEYFAVRAGNGEIARFDGVQAMYSCAPVAFLNVLGFTSPVRDLKDLRARVHAAGVYSRSAGYPFFISVCRDWIPRELHSMMDAVFAGERMTPIMQWTGMAADELSPPLHDAPDLRIVPVADEQTRIAVNDLNSIAYDLPPEPGRGAFNRESIWSGAFGVIGYYKDQPVATATTLPIDGRLFVELVATHPDYRRRGFAEACMRDSLARAAAATGLRRTVLHATDAGRPLYLKMGYRDVTKFHLYCE